MAHRLYRVTAIVALLSGATLAQSNTTTDVGQGQNMVGWVSPGPRRDSWSIICSCLSIFIICTWKCVHLNIPSHQEIQGEWHTLSICAFLQDVPYWPKLSLWLKWRRRIVWMWVIAVAPELGVGIAVKQYIEARRELDSFRETTSGDRLDNYTMPHAFYVRMGGIVVYDMLPQGPINERGFDLNRAIIRNEPEGISLMVRNIETDQNSPILEHGSNAAGSDDLAPTHRGRMIKSLAELDEFGCSFIPKITKNEIIGLSKADAITKTFAILQCTWLVLQSIVRATGGYLISQLELATLAFIFCALVMHGFWWYKPFDVDTRRVLTRISSVDRPLPNPIALSMDDLTKYDYDLRVTRVTDLSGEGIFSLVYQLFDFSDLGHLPSVALYSTALGFSAIHLAAWNWEFSSSLDQTFWRWGSIGAVVALVLPPMFAVVTGVFGSDNSTWARFEYFGFLVAWVVYCFSRGLILTSTFACFRSMPERVYTNVNWMDWIPHFS